MGPIHQAPEEDLEAKLRAMLLRRAADVQPHRPSWETLSAAYEGTVIPLPRAGANGGSEGRRGPGWLRPAVAAASVLVLVLVGTIVIDRAGDGDGEGEGDNASDETAASAEPVDGPRLAAPGNRDFVPLEASPIFPHTDYQTTEELFLNGGNGDELALYDDANAMTDEYLSSVGIAWETRSGLELRTEPAQDDEGRTAVEDLGEGATPNVYWAFYGEDEQLPITQGNVFLRRSAVWDDSDTLVAEPWIVVGAMTYGLRLKDVRRVDDQLSFVVNRSEDTSGIRDVRVEVNGDVLDEGNVAIEEPEPYTYTVPADQPVTIRLQHLDPQPVSVTEMTVPVAYVDAGDEMEPDDGGDMVPAP